MRVVAADCVRDDVLFQLRASSEGSGDSATPAPAFCVSANVEPAFSAMSARSTNMFGSRNAASTSLNPVLLNDLQVLKHAAVAARRRRRERAIERIVRRTSRTEPPAHPKSSRSADASRPEPPGAPMTQRSSALPAKHQATARPCDGTPTSMSTSLGSIPAVAHQLRSARSPGCHRRNQRVAQPSSSISVLRSRFSFIYGSWPPVK